MKGQAEHIAGLISLASLILLAYVAGNTALELQKLGRQIADEVLASKELLEIVRANETRIEIRSRWDGDSWIKYLILCNAYVCNLTSVDTYVPRRGSVDVASLDGLDVANQICVITANENMFCTDSHTASVQEPNQTPPQPRRAWYVVERIQPTYITSASGFAFDSNVWRIWYWRQNKYLLIQNAGIFLYAYPQNRAFLVTELDDIIPSLYQQGKVWINTSAPCPGTDVSHMLDHDDSTSTSFCNAYEGAPILIIDLGQVYTDGVFYIAYSTGYGFMVYFGTDLSTPTATSLIGGSAGNKPNAYWLGSVPGGVRYIWLACYYYGRPVVCDINIQSIEFYPPQSYKSYIIAADPLVPQGLDAYPRTIMAVAVPGTSLRIIEET